MAGVHELQPFVDRGVADRQNRVADDREELPHALQFEAPEREVGSSYGGHVGCPPLPAQRWSLEDSLLTRDAPWRIACRAALRRDGAGVLSLIVRAPQAFDIDLGHLQYGLHDALRL